jgi:predicted aspartyl protease
MGRITATIKVRNAFDEMAAKQGTLEESAVRFVEVEALADSGATLLCLKQSIVQQLGLPLLGERKFRTANGVATRRIYQGAHLFIMGRDTSVNVSEVTDDCPNLIGQIPLEELDFVLDMPGHQIIPNPAHDGEFQLEMYSLTL